MSIVRPDKPPLIGQPSRAVSARVAPVMPRQAAPDAVPAYTPEDMPLEVMTTAPAQPAAPTTETIIVIPGDVQGSPDFADTATPQIIDGAPAQPTEPTEQAEGATATGNAAVDNISEGGGPGAAIPAGLAALGITAAAYARYKSQGTTGNFSEDIVIRSHEAGGISAPDEASDGAAVNTRGADGSPNTRSGTDSAARSTGSERRVARTGRDNSAVPTPDAATPDGPAAGAVDEGTRPIATEEVMPDSAPDIDTSSMPEGTRVVDVNPMQEGRFIDAGPRGDVPEGSRINTQTKEMIVPTGDGRWIIIPPGYSGEATRFNTLRSVRSAIRGAL